MPSSLPADGRIRVVIENVAPAVDGGRFPIKRVAGETVTVEADCFADGHDALACRLLSRPGAGRAWHCVSVTPLANDRWRVECVHGTAARDRHEVEARVHSFRAVS